MKMKTTNFFGILALSGALLAACTGGNKSSENAQKAQTETVSAAQDIPFAVADRYFVNNTVTGIDNPKITSQADFDNYFGMATAMGEDGLPTPIDFSNQYVIAVMKPETDRATTLTPVSLQKTDNGKILFTYKIQTGEQQSYTTIPNLIVIVSRDYDGEVAIEEVN